MENPTLRVPETGSHLDLTCFGNPQGAVSNRRRRIHSLLFKQSLSQHLIGGPHGYVAFNAKPTPQSTAWGYIGVFDLGGGVDLLVAAVSVDGALLVKNFARDL